MDPADGWDDVPCGLLTLRADGTVLAANRTLLDWVSRERADLVGRVRLSELLSVGGRIYWETHLSPLLLVDGRVDEVALELKAPQGRLPVLMTAVVAPGSPGVVHVALSSARERSRYERELRAARTVAERSATQVRALQEVTAALSRAVGLDGVAQALLSAEALRATACPLWLADEEGTLRPWPAGSQRDTPPPKVLALGRVAVAEQGRVLVPLHGQSALQGVLTLAVGDAPGADALDLEVLTAVGQQAGLALDRAQLYEQSASVAHTLQQSLLAVEPPQDERFAVATAYRPGVEMLEVGGDWYDVFLVADGVLSVVVGDVVGRGLGAASAMGQLRSAVRAIVGPEVGPARLLSRLDRFVEPIEAAGMATLAYAELDLATGHVRYACAGHPPPLLLPARGEPRLLWDGRSTPLGAFATPQTRAEAELGLHPGDRLLLYTDGLFERRGRGLDEGLQLLTDTAAGLRALPLDEAVRSLTDTMLADEVVRDDVCVLLLTWSATHFERQLSADLTALSSVRRALGSWLVQHGADERTREDLVLAASEAMANAAEHGSGGRPEAVVNLRARLGQGLDGSDEVVVCVQDHGHWRPAPPSSSERGRGLVIIRALVDDVRVDTGGGNGTTVVLHRRLRREAS